MTSPGEMGMTGEMSMTKGVLYYQFRGKQDPIT
jgi:hypothetical protein